MAPTPRSLRLLLAPALMLSLAAPVAAQTVAPQAEQPSLLDQLIGGLMYQMFEQAAPHLDNLERDLGMLAESMKPTFENIGALIDDIQNYEAPERLPNGDVIIRRKAGAPPPPPLPDLPQNSNPADPDGVLTPFTPDGKIEL